MYIVLLDSMNFMTGLEQKAIKAFKIFWESWENPTESSLKDSVSVWGKHAKGFGTGETEIWRGRKDFEEFCNIMFRQVPEGFTIGINWLETDMLNSSFVMLWGEITITLKLQLKTIVIDPVRITCLFQEVDGKMELIQFHSSESDSSNEGDIWTGAGEPKRYEEASVMLTDFVGFTHMVSTIPAKKLVNELNEIFAIFDEILMSNGIEKIKTMGDAYMAAAGLEDNKDHAVKCTHAAREMLNFLKERNEKQALKWDMRIGIHSGPVVGGLIGSKNLSFDLWGDTVNLASRIESAGPPNEINVSAYTFDLIKEVFTCEYRGKIETKDRGKIDMYLVK